MHLGIVYYTWAKYLAERVYLVLILNHDRGSALFFSFENLFKNIKEEFFERVSHLSVSSETVLKHLEKVQRRIKRKL